MLQRIIPPDLPVTSALKAQFIHPADLRPETQERRLFLALIALLLPVNIAAIKLVNLLRHKLEKSFNNKRLYNSLVFALPILLMRVIAWDDLILMLNWFTVYLLSIASAVFLSSQLRLQLSLPESLTIPWSKPLLLATALVAIFISALPLRLQSVVLVNDDEKWLTSFEAFAYSIAQVSAGKHLLANLPAQYGLYAEFLKPIFNRIGLSVLHLTAVMAGLQILALLALLRVCWLLIKHNLLKILAIISICFSVGGTWLAMRNGVNYSVDEYYQYWPLRFIFPSLSIGLFYWSLPRQQNYFTVALLAGFAGMAMSWNLDSGVPVFGALLAYSLIGIIFPVHEPRRVAIKKLFFVIAITGLWLISFAGYLQMQTTQPIDWQGLIKYQRVFYIAGFFMLPMPTTLHTWMAVVGVYIFAITGTLTQRLHQQQTQIGDCLFFIAILGLGLFAYYQGRSHPLTLTAVVWPALLIAFILADHTLRTVKADLLPSVFKVTLWPVIFIGGMMTTIFMRDLPTLWAIAQRNGKIIANAPKTAVTENIAFIRRYSAGAKTAVIISAHQAVYFCETGLASAIDGPGSGETMLVADERQFYQTLRHQPIQHIFVAQQQWPQVQAYLRHYQIKARSDYGMLYLSRY